MKHLKLRGLRRLSNPLSVLSLPALQRLHVDEVSLQPDPIAALRSLLSHWGSRPREIRIGFPSLPGIDYAAALPAVVFSSTQREPLPIGFLHPRPGPEAAHIDEGDWEEWEEAPLSESEDSASSDSGAESDVQQATDDDSE
ncbi:hypothetical protein B0H16DRAFT_1738592 [Mycena metata]|uniref:Uncharacterized protein n=1 Tax=Mycena metata TaxID=1033252 RepID=A0AAD7HID2_9AGAR|nr:hypothetical protein B0H16DRAFT_1738592 [Mycena metata]